MNLFIFGGSGQLAKAIIHQNELNGSNLQISGYSKRDPTTDINRISSIDESIRYINEKKSAVLFCLHGQTDYIYEIKMLRSIAPYIRTSKPFIYISTAAIYSRERRLIHSSSPERILSKYSLIKKTIELDLLSLKNLHNIHIIRPVDIRYSSTKKDNQPFHCVSAEKVSSLIHSICSSHRNGDRKICSIYLSSDKNKPANKEVNPLLYLSNPRAARFALNQYILRKKGCLNPFLDYINSRHDVSI